ncbi:MAG: hypothetical protein ABWY39_04835 [Mycobacterium sp.]
MPTTTSFICASVAASRDADLADLHLQQVADEDRVFVDSETAVTHASVNVQQQSSATDSDVALVMNAGTETGCRTASTHAVGV